MSSVIDAAVVQHLVLLVAEVVADRPDHAHVGEEARGQREVDRRAAEHALALAEGRLHRVEGDRSDYNQAHRRAEGYPLLDIRRAQEDLQGRRTSGEAVARPARIDRK